MLALVGLDAARYLETEDDEERVVLAAVARSAWRLLDMLQRNQATHIANAMVKARL